MAHQIINFAAQQRESKLEIYKSLPDINSKYLFMVNEPRIRDIISVWEIERVIIKMTIRNVTKHTIPENSDPLCESSEQWWALMRDVRDLPNVPFVHCNCGGLDYTSKVPAAPTSTVCKVSFKLNHQNM